MTNKIKYVRLKMFRPKWSIIMAFFCFLMLLIYISGAFQLQDSTGANNKMYYREKGTSDFLLHKVFGGTFHDAEKSNTNKEDDRLCWAAAASNALAWTDWGISTDFTDEDGIFKYFQDHWTDSGRGSPRRAWYWWFKGRDPSPNGARVDVDGGGFWKDIDFPEYTWKNKHGDLFRGIGAKMIEQNPLAIKELLDDGYAVAAQIVRTLKENNRKSHVISVWGYNYSHENNFIGIYITNSDDDKHVDNASMAENKLVYYPLFFHDGKWWLEGHNNTQMEWHIIAVYALLHKTRYYTGN